MEGKFLVVYLRMVFVHKKKRGKAGETYYLHSQKWDK